MSTLNLALQNVSLARSRMDPEFERMIHNKNTLSEIREATDKNPGLTAALKDSMSSPLITIGQRFQAMEVKGTKVKVGISASTKEQADLSDHVFIIDPSLNKDKLTQKDLSKATDLQEFLSIHAHSSQYVYQLKKCRNPDCEYCQEHPVRTPEGIFTNLSFLPLPRLDSRKDHYQEFSSVFGKPLSEENRPSLSQNFSSEGSRIDKERKAILVSAKVRGAIVCSECYKPQCIYSKAKLSQSESTLVSQLKDSRLYVCGSSLFATGSTLADSVVVKEALTCNSPMEQQYYSAVLVNFEPVCYYCGLGGDGALVQDEVTELKKSYAFVAPICSFVF